MKFIKALINSLISGLFFSTLLALLVLDLNMDLSFKLSEYAQLSLYLGVTYGLFISVICLIFFFIIQFLVGRNIRIAWVSPLFLLISLTSLTFLHLFIFRKNISFFRSFFTPEMSSLLNVQYLTLLFLGILGFFTILGFSSFKKRTFLFIAYYGLFVAVVFYAVKQRKEYPEPPVYKKVSNLEAKNIDKKITLIGLNGLSFDFIIPLTSDGKLPNFSFIMNEGTWGNLENFTPSETHVLCTSLNTGKLPSKHRQLSSNKFKLLNFSHELHVVPRYIFFRQLSRTGLLKTTPVLPKQNVKNIWNIFEANGTSYLKRDWLSPRQDSQKTPEALAMFNRFFEDIRFEKTSIVNIVRKSFCSDAEYESLVAKEKEQRKTQLLSFFLPGLNHVQKYFYKYSFPDQFGQISQEELNKFNKTIERYYQFYDEIIGKYLTSKKEDELLVIYAPHGIDPLPLWKRIIEWIFGNPHISAYHENSPDGAVFFLGRDIARKNYIEGMKLIDVAPTLLHYLGLPVGKDMDGIVNSSIFTEEFNTENPVLYITSYEETEIKKPPQ